MPHKLFILECANTANMQALLMVNVLSVNSTRIALKMRRLLLRQQLLNVQVDTSAKRVQTTNTWTLISLHKLIHKHQFLILQLKTTCVLEVTTVTRQLIQRLEHQYKSYAQLVPICQLSEQQLSQAASTVPKVTSVTKVCSQALLLLLRAVHLDSSVS